MGLENSAGMAFLFGMGARDAWTLVKPGWDFGISSLLPVCLVFRRSVQAEQDSPFIMSLWYLKESISQRKTADPKGVSCELQIRGH